MSEFAHDHSFLAHPDIKEIRVGLSTPLTDIEAASLVYFIRDQENEEQASSRSDIRIGNRPINGFLHGDLPSRRPSKASAPQTAPVADIRSQGIGQAAVVTETAFCQLYQEHGHWTRNCPGCRRTPGSEPQTLWPRAKKPLALPSLCLASSSSHCY